MSTVQVTSEIFSRTVAFAQASRWKSIPSADAIANHLAEFRVLITGDPGVLETEAGQEALALLVNLVARFCPSLEFEIPIHQSLLVAGNPSLHAPGLADAVASLPTAIWGAAKPPGRQTSNAIDLVVSVGNPPREYKTGC